MACQLNDYNDCMPFFPPKSVAWVGMKTSKIVHAKNVIGMPICYETVMPLQKSLMPQLACHMPIDFLVMPPTLTAWPVKFGTPPGPGHLEYCWEKEF